MEAPLCKLCDPPRRHWRHEPHKFADPNKEFHFGGGPEWKMEDIGFIKSERPLVANRIPETKTGRKLKSEFVGDDGYFDRVAYQREYMRKRRAAKKESK